MVAAVAWPAFQCYQLVNESEEPGHGTRQSDPAVRGCHQAPQFARCDRPRDGILADKGNPGAKLIVGELARRGVTINPDAPVGAPEQAHQVARTGKSARRREGAHIAAQALDHASASSPCCTISAARSTARALFRVSVHSDSGTESWTMPAPACA